MYKIFSATIAASAIGVAMVSPSFSQATSDQMPQMGMMGGNCPMMGMMGQGHMRQRMMQGGMGMRHSRMGAMVEGRLAYLKAELKITEEQELVWQEYSDAAKDRVGIMQGMRQGMLDSMHSGSAIARMETRINGMEAMLEAMKAVKPSVEKLYSALTDDQKKVADDLIGTGCGAM